MATRNELEELAEDESQQVATRRIAGALAEAIADWPAYNLITLNAYVAVLRREVGSALTQANIRAKLDSYSFVDEDIWKFTSLSDLLNAWDISDEDVALEALIKRIGIDIQVSLVRFGSTADMENQFRSTVIW